MRSGQALVEQRPGCVEAGLGPESHRRHDFRHQPQERLAVLLLVLPGRDRVEQAHPFGVLLIPGRLGHFKRSDQIRDLRTGHRISEHLADLLDSRRGERRNDHGGGHTAHYLTSLTVTTLSFSREARIISLAADYMPRSRPLFACRSSAANRYGPAGSGDLTAGPNGRATPIRSR